MLLQGYDEAALIQFRRAFQSVNSNSGLAYYAEALRRVEGAEAARQLLERGKFIQNESPAVLQVRLAVYEELGLEAELSALLERVQSLYPDHPVLVGQPSSP